METCEDTVKQSISTTLPSSASFCLICGELLNKVIKHEQDHANCTWENEERERDISHNRVTLIHEASPWSDEEFRMFQQLMKWFKLKLGRKIFWNKECEYFPFCVNCKEKLTILSEIQKKLDELTAALKDGVQEIKCTMDSCEKVFGGNNIYDKDIRYYEVRRQLVKVSAKPTNNQPGRLKKAAFETRKEKNPDSTGSSPMSPESKPGESRKSARSRKSVMRYNCDLGDENQQTLMSSSPVVLFSAATDKIKAEKHLSSSSVTEADKDKAREHLPHNSKSKSTLRSSEATKINYVKYYWDETTKNPLELDRHKDFVVEPGPSKMNKRGHRKKKQEGPNIKLKEDDLDFVLHEDALSEQSYDNDEMDEDDIILDDDLRRNRKCKERVTFDENNATYSCMNFVFDGVPGKIDQYTCRNCEQLLNFENKNSFKKHRAIKFHVLKYHTDRFVCKICGHHEGSLGSLKRHAKLKHLGFSEYKLYHKKSDGPCSVCAKPGIARTWMKRHLWSHKSKEERNEAIARGEKDPYPKTNIFQCEKCGKDFFVKHEWKRHTEISHQTEEEREKRKELCTVCGKVTLNLRSHMLAYHNETRRIECSICNKPFGKWAEVRKHKKAIHLNLRPFACTQCPRTFTVAGVLKDHMKLHLNIRDFKCEHCPAAFHKKGTLVRHINTYHVEGAKVPKRKSYQRGPTQLKSEQRKADLVKSNTYCPPSYKSWWKAKPV